MAVWSEVAISEVGKSERYDPEYWQPAFIKNEEKLNAINCISLGAASDRVRSGPFGSNILCENYVSNGIAVIRPFNIKGMTIERENIAFIPESVCSQSKLAFYRESDIMIARVGDVRAGIVHGVSSKITISPNVIAVRLRDCGLSPYYVVAFLNTWSGLAQMQRGMKTVAQPTITTDLVRAIRIPIVENFMQNKIENKVKEAFRKNDEAKDLYSQSERLLLSNLELEYLDLSPTLYYERFFSETQQSGRVDSEYFQPKYHRLLERLNTCSFRKEFLGSLIAPISNGYDYREFSEEGLPYIRVGDVSKGCIDAANAMKINIKWNDIKKDIRLKKGDVLLTRKGSYGNAAFVREDQINCVISSEIMLLRITDSALFPEYLSVFLNSPIGFQQIERLVHGAAFYSISQPALASIRIIVLPEQMQEAIVKLVQQADNARDEAHCLLEEAKQMVEEAILGGRQ